MGVVRPCITFTDGLVIGITAAIAAAKGIVIVSWVWGNRDGNDVGRGIVDGYAITAGIGCTIGIRYQYRTGNGIAGLSERLGVKSRVSLVPRVVAPLLQV